MNKEQRDIEALKETIEVLKRFGRTVEQIKNDLTRARVDLQEATPEQARTIHNWLIEARASIVGVEWYWKEFGTEIDELIKAAKQGLEDE